MDFNGAAPVLTKRQGRAKNKKKQRGKEGRKKKRKKLNKRRPRPPRDPLFLFFPRTSSSDVFVFEFYFPGRNRAFQEDLVSLKRRTRAGRRGRRENERERKRELSDSVFFFFEKTKNIRRTARLIFRILVDAEPSFSPSAPRSADSRFEAKEAALIVRHSPCLRPRF